MDPSPKKFSQRIPPPVGEIQVNFCKDPKCPNFGIPALLMTKGAAFGAAPAKGKSRSKDSYTIGSLTSNVLRLECHYCYDKPPIKSNLGVHEELERLSAYLTPAREASCQTPGCENEGKGVHTFLCHYQRFGTTKAGSVRYRCKACKKLLSVATKSILRQRKSHKNKTLFRLLVNKSPLRRSSEITELNVSSIYDKIDFIHRQCLAWAGSVERDLPTREFGSLYLSTDRQVYSVNWTNTNIKRNVLMYAVGTADNKSGYVFGMHLNFDPRLSGTEIEEEAKACGDLLPTTKVPFRRYARLWLGDDYRAAAAKALTGARRSPGGRRPSHGWLESLDESYAEAVSRDDIESSDTPLAFTMLPGTGVQVHAEYTLYGHFYFLKRLLAGAKKLRFYMEKESGIRAACHAAFADDITAKRVDTFFLRVNKELNNNEKLRKVQAGKRELDEFRDSNIAYSELSDASARVMLIEQRLRFRELKTIGPFKDLWLDYPAPSKDEPEKMVSHQTDIGALEPNHLARLYAKASLHGIDRFMMQVRRRLSLLERPIDTSSNKGQKWYGYCPYRPEMVAKLLDILRVYYNFVLKGDDKRTPAMRLGLTERPTPLEEILYFVP